jgi:cytochrome c peroxidase
MAPPLAPADNPMSAEKVELGRRLFYDKRLSMNETVSCASCHEQARAFSDGRPRAIGADGQAGARNAMSLGNVAYLPTLTWANPHARTLEAQAAIPLFGEAPNEMGMSGREEELFARLRADPVYIALFPKAFVERGGEISLFAITRALAAFERSLLSFDSPYDRAKHGAPEAMRPAAKRGEALFFSHELECYHCHGGPNFSDSFVSRAQPTAEVGFHNTGLYNGANGAYPAGDQGLFEHTAKAADMGRYRTPSLRNVEVTGPYMHDGSIATLEEVVAAYARGGRKNGAEDGALNPYKDPMLQGFDLTLKQRDDLVAFLKSLTDQRFLSNPVLSDPWPNGHPAKGKQQ